MAARAEVTTRYATAYARASEKDKRRVLNEVAATPARRLERHGELVGGADRYSDADRYGDAVRVKLLSMSAATIDRYLNRRWQRVNDRPNHLTSTKKPIPHGSNRNGRQAAQACATLPRPPVARAGVH